jgi:hypothetical protein
MMIKSIIIISLFLACNILYSQEDECKVLKSDIAGTYSGGCRNGLAHGKGIAQGIDHYEGQFSKGLPDGKGKYTWSTGVYYDGQWKDGMRDGKGRMVYPDSVVTGYWKADKYLGKKILSPYKIISSLSVSRYTVQKSADRNFGVRIRLMQGGHDNISIEDFSMAYDSGTEYRSGNYYGIENVSFPLTVKLKYRSWNYLMTSQYNVIFEILFNEPGSWDIVLNN